MDDGLTSVSQTLRQSCLLSQGHESLIRSGSDDEQKETVYKMMSSLSSRRRRKIRGNDLIAFLFCLLESALAGDQFVLLSRFAKASVSLLCLQREILL
jgi:hypothetical protein